MPLHCSRHTSAIFSSHNLEQRLFEQMSHPDAVRHHVRELLPQGLEIMATMNLIVQLLAGLTDPSRVPEADAKIKALLLKLDMRLVRSGNKQLLLIPSGHLFTLWESIIMPIGPDGVIDLHAPPITDYQGLKPLRKSRFFEFVGLVGVFNTSLVSVGTALNLVVNRVAWLSRLRDADPNADTSGLELLKSLRYEYLAPLNQVLLCAIGPLVSMCTGGPLAFYSRDVPGVSDINAVPMDLIEAYYSHPYMRIPASTFAELVNEASLAIMEPPFTADHGQMASNGVLLTEQQESGVLWRYLPRTFSTGSMCTGAPSPVVHHSLVHPPETAVVPLAYVHLRPVLTEEAQAKLEIELGLVY